jgi:hypothetical protein
VGEEKQEMKKKKKKKKKACGGIYMAEGVEEPQRLSPWPSDGREAVVSENEKHG